MHLQYVHLPRCVISAYPVVLATLCCLSDCGFVDPLKYTKHARKKTMWTCWWISAISKCKGGTLFVNMFRRDLGDDDDDDDDDEARKLPMDH